MAKSVHTTEYDCFLRVLRALREDSGVTQMGLAEALGITQSHLSKLERGELRIDIVQARDISLALGSTLPKLVKDFERALSDSGS